ncbi:MAG: precorrin-8X methylmutase [Candidatus Pacebacteria bacterium]|nr:precorrin-8X methylmutase [Candidatus Paceibacterota bacterium]
MLSDLEQFKTAAEIYAESWRRCRAATDLSHLPTELHGLALRLVHCCGEPTIVESLAASPTAVPSLTRAIQTPAAILVDAEMVAAGIIRRFLPANKPIICTLDQVPVTPATETRSAAAVRFWQPHLSRDSIVVIGNAPTALARLLQLIDQGELSRPAVVVGFCVGFVAAQEAKAQLMARDDIPWLALSGRRGGSALAAAAINAAGAAASQIRGEEP